MKWVDVPPLSVTPQATGKSGSDAMYTVSYYRNGDSPNGGELYGIYKTKEQANQAVAAIQKWAATIKDPDWKIARIQVDKNGSDGWTSPAVSGQKASTSGLNSNKTSSSNKTLGWLSERYEAGKRGPGTISTGVGDKGGVSYGSFQLSSKTGTVQSFVNQFYAKDFKGLQPGTQAFNKVWTRLATTQKDKFHADQLQFIKQTHYDPVVRKLREDLGINVDTLDSGVQNAVFSTAVQNGKKGGAHVLEKALENLMSQKPLTAITEAEYIEAIYRERGRKDAEGNLVYFKGSSKKVQEGVSKRFSHEMKDALDDLTTEQRNRTLQPSMPMNPLP
jgi:hypothetical protein